MPSTSGRPQGVNLPWVPVFLDALAATGVVAEACRVAKTDRRTAYRTKSRCPELSRLWDDAMEASADVLEREAFRRAVVGVEEPVFGNVQRRDRTGKTITERVQIAKVRKYSDSLLMFLLKGARPEKYRERAQVDHEHTHRHAIVDWRKFKPEELRTIAKRLAPQLVNVEGGGGGNGPSA